MKPKISILAGALLAASTWPSMAADLGGNCCADLEERVAELEAVAARKGNRRVSLTVSGHVHEAIFAYDVESDDVGANEANMHIGTHNSSRSRVTFRGQAAINADWSAGFLMEFGVRAAALNATSQDAPRTNLGLDIRHEALYIKSRSFGTVWMGWTSAGIDGITEICLGCAIGNASPDYSGAVNNLIAARDVLVTINKGLNAVGPIPTSVDISGVPGAKRANITFRSAASASGAFPGEGDRRNMIKWTSPAVAGFAVSASWGGDDYWDAALRYAGEFGSMRLAAGIGYSQDTNGVGNSEGVSAAGCLSEDDSSDRDCRTLGGSVSMMHVPSGLYFRGSWGQNTNKLAILNGSKDQGWEITAGISQKWNSLGKTNIWAVYGQTEREMGLLNFSVGTLNGETASLNSSSDLTTYGFGLQQNIDAAAMELYIWYRHYEAAGSTTGRIGTQSFTLSGEAEADVITAGARIKF